MLKISRTYADAAVYSDTAEDYAISQIQQICDNAVSAVKTSRRQGSTPEEIAGSVKVKGRDGTILQPGINLLEKAKDFPKDRPFLIITNGEIEDKLRIHRKHGCLLPVGNRMLFKARRR